MTDLAMIRRDIPVLEVARALGLAMSNRGRWYVSRCPFHHEKTASFTVFTETNTWYCFGKCGCGTSNIDLVMKKLSYSLTEAVDWLKEKWLGFIKDKKSAVLYTPKPKIYTLFSHELINYYSAMLFACNRQEWFNNRGLSDATIADSGLGWDGSRYVTPVWAGEPFQSNCVNLRLRASELSGKPKYISADGSRNDLLFGLGYINKTKPKIVIAQAGEGDTLLAQQDLLPTVSTVGGMGSIGGYPKNWPNLWFPDTPFMITSFDYKETVQGAKLGAQWVKSKGRGSLFITHWILNDYVDDYTEFRLSGGVNEYLSMLSMQIKNKAVLKELQILRR